MADFISIEVDEDEVMRGFDLQEAVAKRLLRNLVDDLADRGMEVLEMHAPEWSTYTKRHIDRTDVDWMPDNMGGTYQAIVGVKTGTSYHPVYAELGTGIYSYTSNFIRSPRGGLMYFYSILYGHVIAKYEVAGQPPQHYLYATWRDLAIYTAARLTTEAFVLSVL